MYVLTAKLKLCIMLLNSANRGDKRWLPRMIRLKHPPALVFREIVISMFPKTFNAFTTLCVKVLTFVNPYRLKRI